MPFGPGETFERYAIEALIGRGGMGEVYRAFDTRLRRKVALKVIRADKDRPDGAARLYREARGAAALTHPNAVAVHDVGEAEGVFYIVMELVVGQPLLAYVGDVRVTVLKKIAWLTDIARALAAAHRAGIIHRDVKPSNVMVSEDGFPKVLDFGLARPLGPIDPVSFRTQEGRVLGTLRYMAPEQMAGAEADARSDQYAFGLTAYELLAGTHPGGAIIEAKPKRIDEIAKDIAADAATVVERTLARNPDDRYATMDDVVHALEASISTMRAPPPYMTPPPMTSALPSEETAETISAYELAPAKPGRSTTLITKEAPSALVRGRDVRPAANTLPLNVVAPPIAMPMSPGVAPAPRTLVSGQGAQIPSSPPPGAAVAIPSSPPPRRPSAAPKDNLRRTIIISVAVLSVAAFTGTYFGSRAAPPGTPATAATASSPAPAVSSSALIPFTAATNEPASSASVRTSATTSTAPVPPTKPPKAIGGLGF